MARALIKRPKVILLDNRSEPWQELREETQYKLMDLQEAAGTTSLVVTRRTE